MICLNFTNIHINPGMIYPTLQDKLKCFFSISHIRITNQCRRPPPSPLPPLRNTAPTIFVLGTNIKEPHRPIFIPSNIITRTVKNAPNYMTLVSWFYATTSPK